MTAWRIWYADGSIVSSDDCTPAEVPGRGVIVIVQPDTTPGVGNVGYVPLHGYDHYYWHKEDEEWAGAVGESSMWDLIEHRAPIEGVSRGCRVSKRRYAEIVKEAEAWAEQQGLPRKSGRRWDESPL